MRWLQGLAIALTLLAGQAASGQTATARSARGG